MCLHVSIHAKLFTMFMLWKGTWQGERGFSHKREIRDSEVWALNAQKGYDRLGGI